eukprot:TRINITY_DN2783_c0_g1_i1.p2 TRINITY_DN2783_c0_g1~~TRINITY_DN2783_c0_g1_i1.p2  ORF type:complete len:383 (-),score=88.53 TRINITY_DN2783_c0_g1_i1:626-1774(-)
MAQPTTAAPAASSGSSSPGLVVSADQLDAWQQDPVDLPSNDLTDDPLAHQGKSRLPCNDVLNGILCLWQGDVWNVACDAIVNPAEESYTDHRGISGFIFRHAGARLDDEVAVITKEDKPECRTGEPIITEGYNLPCRKVIHVVGPKYNERYTTASLNSLHNCYRNCLQMLVEKGLRTIAFPPIHSEYKNFFATEAVPMVLRTIRRFLERYPGKVEKVVLVISNPQDYRIYHTQMRWYFPRNKREEQEAAKKLPLDLGNELGEIVPEERKSRVGLGPSKTINTKSSLDQYAATLGRKNWRNPQALSRPVVSLPEGGGLDTEATVPVEVATVLTSLGPVSRVPVVTGTGSKVAELTSEEFSAMMEDPDAIRKRAAKDKENCTVM